MNLYNIDRKKLATAIDNGLKTHHMSEKTLGSILSLSKKTIIKLKNNQSPVLPSDEQLERLCITFSIDINTLLIDKPLKSIQKEDDCKITKEFKPFYLFNEKFKLKPLKLSSIILLTFTILIMIASIVLASIIAKTFTIFSTLIALIIIMYAVSLYSLIKLKDKIDMNTFNKTMLAKQHYFQKISISSLKLSPRFIVAMILNVVTAGGELIYSYTLFINESLTLIIILNVLCAIYLILNLLFLFVASKICKHFDSLSFELNDKKRVFDLTKI